MLKYFYGLLISVIGFFTWNENPTDELAYTYIDQYKEIAIVEMHRTGIPASITLAQALHESGLGNSRLAVYAKNHFGIKCKSYWQGKTFQHKDDDFDKKGNLMNSCFRAYDTVIDSYVDHSNFLTQSARYSELFDFDKTDYKRWAYGLKKCNYATDLQYAFKLIDKIERYNLQAYDYSPNPLLR